ncbi:thiol-disulfide oxidoreductase DCC family protein [Robertkochia marina]|uniref:Thiol-disulfide oxidoreductase DCC family protein n=1 Tax=Robertkochia marina TaxID=1227945 RepID=A0A4S3M1J4_9FLAO|nr:thiol-disulfide oxidoreductase DCC family protein [Robertkochia marina]THD67907.1 thiol-disulfide oxidoreductase DCC family protein [Robertkochia marina]TRZ41014.1 thiol-disulfide oxidoreductase DCC family protein [Robertkochia marina]
MKLENGKKLILFDGVCNLCNGAVNFVIKRDHGDVFRYASLQSNLGKKMLEERNIDPKSIDSIILIEPEIAYFIKSDAAIEIARHLGWPWKALTLFNYILPVSIRDGIYDLIARNRYRWFGRKDQCMLPTPALKAKFLDL